jgi:hypothetical protein
MEEGPAFIVALIQDFLRDRVPSAPQLVRSAALLAYSEVQVLAVSALLQEAQMSASPSINPM